MIDPVITLRRTVQYGLNRNRKERMALPTFPPASDGEICTGWISETLVSESKNAEKLKELQKINADEAQLSIFQQLFAEEKNKHE